MCRRASAAVGLLAFVLVCIHWLLATMSGGAASEAETVLARAAMAGAAGCAVGWVACRLFMGLLAEVRVPEARIDGDGVGPEGAGHGDSQGVEIETGGTNGGLGRNV